MVHEAAVMYVAQSGLEHALPQLFHTCPPGTKHSICAAVALTHKNYISQGVVI